MLSEMSERERQILYVFTYIWNLKYKTHKGILKNKADSNTSNHLFVFTSGEGWERDKISEGD